MEEKNKKSMPRETKRQKKGNAEKPVSLRPLRFDEVVSDLLKVKPVTDKKRKAGKKKNN